MGVAAKARSVHSMSSKDQKLGRKGGARPHPQQQHPLPQGPQFSTKCWLATGSPQTIPQKTHSIHKAKCNTTPSRLFCHTAHTRAHLISCVRGATPPPHNHTHSTPLLLFLWSHSPHPRGTWRGQRLHSTGGHAHLSLHLARTSHKWSMDPQGHAQPETTKPTLTHTHTAHKTWGTPTSLIRAKWLLCQRLKIYKECFDLAFMWAMDHMQKNDSE